MVAQSPLGADEGVIARAAANEASGPYLEAWASLVRAIGEGEPWSGSERNSLFLQGRPAAVVEGQRSPQLPPMAMVDVAPILGVDDPGDGRGAALIDLDFDGDDDLVLSARTAPRVKLLRNSVADGASHVSVRLEGARVNRDAIGATLFVDVLEDGEVARTLRRERTAGAGYLAQSSAWLRVGVGAPAEGARRAARVRLRVRWPRMAGEAEAVMEDFGEVRAGESYILREGTGAALARREGAAVELEAAPITLGPDAGATDQTSRFRAVLPTPAPVPRLLFLTPAGTVAEFFGTTPQGPVGLGKPVLISAFRGQGAIDDMGDLRAVAGDLARAGIGAVALDLTGAPEEGAADALAALTARLGEAGWRHDAGLAVAETEAIVSSLVAWRLRRAVPLGGRLAEGPYHLLFDEDGRLAVLRVGPLERGELLTDLAAVAAAESVRRGRLAVLSPGTWLRPPTNTGEGALAVLLGSAGAPLARREVELARIRVAGNVPTPYDIAMRVGEGHLQQQPPALDEALAAFEKALTADPEGIQAWRGKAYVLQLQGKFAPSLDAWTRALDLAPGDVSTRAYRALAAVGAGEIEVARGDLAELQALGAPAAQAALAVQGSIARYEAAREGSGDGGR